MRMVVEVGDVLELVKAPKPCDGDLTGLKTVKPLVVDDLDSRGYVSIRGVKGRYPTHRFKVITEPENVNSKNVEQSIDRGGRKSSNRKSAKKAPITSDRGWADTPKEAELFEGF